MEDYSIGAEPQHVPNLKQGTEDTPFGKGDILIVKGQQHSGDVAWLGNWEVVDPKIWANKVKSEIEAQGHKCLWVHINVKYEIVWTPWPVNRTTITEDFAIYGQHDMVQAGVIIAIVVVAIVAIYIVYRTIAPVIWHANGITPEQASGYSEAASPSLFDFIIGKLGTVVLVVLGVFIVILVWMFGWGKLKKKEYANE